jgi:hypothetical protein
MPTTRRYTAIGCLALAACLALPYPLGAGQDRPDKPKAAPGIRAEGPLVEHTLQRGVALSPTLRSLVEGLLRTDLIVYVALTRRPAGRSDASIDFMHATGEFRFVRIAINIELKMPQRLALLGHELQHALEVAQAPEIRDRASFLRYYGAVGVHHLDPRALDTEAARQVGERVREEFALASATIR